MSIDDVGFLSSDMSRFATEIYGKHQDLFDFCKTANAAGHLLKNRLQIPANDRRKSMAACLYTRVLNGFQAAFLLCFHGMPIEAAMIVRSMYEAHNYLKKLVEEEGFLEKYLRDGARVYQKEIRYLLEKRPFRLSLEEEAKLKADLAELEERKIGKKDDLRMDQLGASTYSIYKVLSRTAHPKADGLEETYITNDPETGDTTLEWGPNDRNLGMILITAHDVLLPSMYCLATLFGFDISDVVKQIDERFASVRNAEFGGSGGVRSATTTKA